MRAQSQAATATNRCGFKGFLPEGDELDDLERSLAAF